MVQTFPRSAALHVWHPLRPCPLESAAPPMAPPPPKHTVDCLERLSLQWLGLQRLKLLHILRILRPRLLRFLRILQPSFLHFLRFLRPRLLGFLQLQKGSALLPATRAVPPSCPASWLPLKPLPPPWFPALWQPA